ncbi:hypothetical protein Sgou_51940 [Streptomyces gougerotii]|uniref:Uncharacterized protein n=1 Tax=Streptomyces gougerotii TaxID=53448 RepID=A0ABQ1DDB1_9ACTN|nr:hypothetical protein [Streptomyces gougerotii]GFH80524.1 hypothetical protein Sgou_51940 [Streptomyces gougerotii]
MLTARAGGPALRYAGAPGPRHSIWKPMRALARTFHRLRPERRSGRVASLGRPPRLPAGAERLGRTTGQDPPGRRPGGAVAGDPVENV